ncbi:MAG: hypothetical protein JKY56_27505 [Kofleriaceae bacterium]|nr:hypothetical protein [Kofleriaceae bacterium]
MSTSLRSRGMPWVVFCWLVPSAALLSSCFSPQRSDALSCSVEGQCPGLQVCDYDQICRDLYSVDGGATVVDSGAEFVDAALPDAEIVRQSIVPVGRTTTTDPLGLTFGDEFGPILCPPGEVMYGYEGSNSSAAGLCRLRAQCGHLQTSLLGVELIRDGATIPLTGLGALDCTEFDGVSSVTCPDNSVVSGVSGIRSGPSFAIAVTSFSLHCAGVSMDGTPLQSVQTKSSGPIYSVEMPEETVMCTEGTVVVGFGGTGTTAAIGHNFICSALEVEAQ